MTVQPIRLLGDPVLHTPAQPVATFDQELRQLVRDLSVTMIENGGAGLAAPQIGVGLRVFVFHIDGRLGHLVNPQLEFPDDQQQTGDEGCLSIPGLLFDTPRHTNVIARGFNQHGDPIELTGSQLLARCIQHETDHLDGILFVERLDPAAHEAAMKAIREAEWYDPTRPPTIKQSPH